jgi:hypothetical protein
MKTSKRRKGYIRIRGYMRLRAVGLKATQRAIFSFTVSRQSWITAAVVDGHMGLVKGEREQNLNEALSESKTSVPAVESLAIIILQDAECRMTEVTHSIFSLVPVEHHITVYFK